MSKDKFLFGYYDQSEMENLLHKADQDPLLSGFVYPEDDSRIRFPIFKNSILVGFATPRQDKDGVWRMGAIYILKEFRNQGIARNAISQFMKDKLGRAFIEDDNVASQKAYRAAGFSIVRSDPENKGSWWENLNH